MVFIFSEHLATPGESSFVFTQTEVSELTNLLICVSSNMKCTAFNNTVQVGVHDRTLR